MTNSNFAVVSWNVNSVKARLPHVLTYLNEKQPDILCLQELKCTSENFPYSDFRELGYEAAVHGQKTYNGVAILSRLPMDEVIYGFDGKKSETSARLICTKIGKVNIYSVYVPNGQEVGSDKYKEKLLFFKSLFACLQERHEKNDAVIMGGDFNVAPADADVHDPELWRGRILFSDRERKALDTFASLGLTDTYRSCNKSGKDFSWWDYRGFSFQKNQGLRIDLIYSSQVLVTALTKAGIDREFRRLEKPSDHAPVYTEFLLPKGLLVH